MSAPLAGMPFDWGYFKDLELPSKNSATYLHPKLGVFDRITSVLQVLNKPALIVWSARLEREAILTAVDDGATTRRGIYESLAARYGLAKDGTPKWVHIVERSAAAGVGGNAHDAAEAYLKGNPVGPLSAPEQAAYQAARAWLVDTEAVPIGVEKRVYSPSLKIAGTLDLAAELEIAGERIHAVIDWKTASGHYFEQLVQIAFYSHALREAGYPERLHGVVVRLPKDGSPADPRVYSPTQMEQYESFLVAAAILYRAQREYEQEYRRNGR